MFLQMSLWSLDIDRFNETDFLMEQYEKREEWSLLHGDAEPQPTTPNQETVPCSPSSSE